MIINKYFFPFTFRLHLTLFMFVIYVVKALSVRVTFKNIYLLIQIPEHSYAQFVVAIWRQTTVIVVTWFVFMGSSILVWCVEKIFRLNLDFKFISGISMELRHERINFLKNSSKERLNPTFTYIIRLKALNYDFECKEIIEVIDKLSKPINEIT